MAVKSRFIRNKWCRWFRAGYIWVPEDGSEATTLIDGHYKKLKIASDIKGKWAIHPWGHKIHMAFAVITCYCPPHPNDGKRYEIGYKDGDNTNCSKDNLFWEEYHYRHCNKTSATLFYKDSKVEVNIDGSIKVDGKTADIHTTCYDADMDLFNCIYPFVIVGTREKYFVEDIMKDAGYVNGDDACMVRPVILHRDNNWLNFASSNLEWVEESDPRYIEFGKIMCQAVNDEIIAINPGKQVPDFYLCKN